MLKKLISTTLLLLPVLVIAAERAKVKLPAPYATPSASNSSKLIERPAGAKLNVPPGFTAEEWGSGFKKPRFMVQLASGTVLVADSIPNGSVVAVTGGVKKDLKLFFDAPAAPPQADGNR